MKRAKKKKDDSEIESDLAHFARQYSEFLPFCLSSSPWETSDGRNERYPILDPKKAIRLVRAIIKNNSRSLEKRSWFRPDGLDVYVRYNTKG